MRNRLPYYTLSTIMAAFCTCANLGGIGHEGEARISGRVIVSTGTPAPQTLVMLFPADYDPAKDPACFPGDTTDFSGSYSFSGLDPGRYSVQAVHLDNRTSAFVSGISVSGDTVVVPDVTLQIPGAIKVMLPDSVSSATGYVYVPGTSVLVFLNNLTDFVVLDSAPAGVAPAIFYSSTNGTAVATIRYDVPVPSGDTVTVWNPSWKYARELLLNTTQAGAGVAGTVAGFPVLVKLTSAHFSFPEAKADGADIRFTKPDNTFLSYEIERWDSSCNAAEVWVNVDTILGNNSSQYLVMYWGNPDAASGSNSAAVFDTAAGFAGVWHLGQPAGAIVPDATANGINGTATATATVSGAIGAAQSFNGTSSLIQTAASASNNVNFSDSGTYTVSAWVKANALDSLFHGIVYKSNFQYGLQMRPKNEWEFFTYIEKSRWEMSRSPASDNVWHALAGVRNGTKQYLYVDGICVDSSMVNVASNITRAYDQPLQIGHCPDGGADPDRFFNGIIDEVRISSVSSGADWIKLCYMNQKEQDALVKW